MASVPIDRYVLESLMPELAGHDRRPAAFLVYLALWSRTNATRVRDMPVSLRELTECTGLSKRAVQEAVRQLARRRLIGVTRARATAIPAYSVLRPWIRKS